MTLSRHYWVGIWHGGVLGVHESPLVCTPKVPPGERDRCSNLTESCEIWDHVSSNSPLPEDHRAHIILTADSSRHHHCKLGGCSASISGTSV